MIKKTNGVTSILALPTTWAFINLLFDLSIKARLQWEKKCITYAGTRVLHSVLLEVTNVHLQEASFSLLLVWETRSFTPKKHLEIQIRTIEFYFIYLDPVRNPAYGH